jgi:hypothetical protein
VGSKITCIDRFQFSTNKKNSLFRVAGPNIIAFVIVDTLVFAQLLVVVVAINHNYDNTFFMLPK